jgi:hypothetical protein
VVALRVGRRGEDRWWREYGLRGDAWPQAVARQGDGYVLVGNDDGTGVDGSFGWVLRIDAAGEQQWRSRLPLRAGRLRTVTVPDGGDAVVGGTAGGDGSGAWVGAIAPGGDARWLERFGPDSLSSVRMLATTRAGDVVGLGNTLFGQDGQDGYLIGFAAPKADPMASVDVSPASPAVGEAVTFDASESRAPGGSLERFDWDLNGDGSVDATGPVVAATFDEPGVHDVVLRVTDDEGATAIRQVRVGVGDGTPAGTTTPIDPGADDGRPVTTPGFGVGTTLAGIGAGLLYHLGRVRGERKC